jgi:hypothetical protein
LFSTRKFCRESQRSKALFAGDERGKMMERLMEISEINFSYALTVLDKNGIGQRKYQISSIH